MLTADPASATPSEIDVFVSHSSLDDATVNRIHDALTAAGLNTWVDHRDIRADQRWSDEVQKALDGCKSALYVFSANSQDSAECQYEWEYILKRGIALMVAVIDPAPTKNIHYRIETKQRTSLNKDFDAGITEIVRAIKGVPPAAPTTTSGRKFTGTIAPEHRDWDLIGRDDDLTAIRNWFANDDKPVTILGLGGVGKTRLAAEIAQKFDFPAGVIWLRIDSSTTLDSLTEQIRRHFFGTEPAEADTIWDRLRSQKALLVLDNAEDCTQPVAFADRINSLRGSSARVMITSRHLGGWEKLGNPHKRDLAAPSAVQALRILIEMAQIKEPAFWDESRASELVDAARQHPRLLEKALDWLNNFEPPKVLKLLRTLKGIDAEQLLDDMIRKTVEQARAQKGGEEAIALLRKLAVCRGGFTLAAAEAIGGEDQVRDSLPLLRRWGLVTVQNQRYDIDPLVTAAIGEDESAHEQHTSFYETLAWRQTEIQDYFSLDVETQNLEFAFEWLFRQARYEEVYLFANSCEEFQRNRGRFNQNMNWMKRIGAMLKDSGDDNLIAAAKNSLGTAYASYPLGNVRDNLRLAIDSFSEALNIFAVSDKPSEYAGILNNIGGCFRSLATFQDRNINLQLAIDSYREALFFCAFNKVPQLYSLTQNNLGATFYDLAQVQDQEANLHHAINCFLEALHYRTPNTVPLDYAITKTNLGLAYANLATVQDDIGNVQLAIDCYHEALRFSTFDTAPLDYATTNYHLGVIYLKLAESQDRSSILNQAHQSFRESLRVWTTTHYPLQYAQTQTAIGHIFKEANDLPAAIRCWCEAAKYYRLMQAEERAQLMERWIADAGGNCDDPA